MMFGMDRRLAVAVNAVDAQHRRVWLQRQKQMLDVRANDDASRRAILAHQLAILPNAHRASGDNRQMLEFMAVLGDIRVLGKNRVLHK